MNNLIRVNLYTLISTCILALKTIASEWSYIPGHAVIIFRSEVQLMGINGCCQYTHTITFIYSQYTHVTLCQGATCK